MPDATALFVLVHSPGPAWQAGVAYPEQPGIMEHIGFMRSLAEEDRSLAAGLLTVAVRPWRPRMGSALPS